MNTRKPAPEPVSPDTMTRFLDVAEILFSEHGYAKTSLRAIAKRADINHSRISRIRTFIKAVESALESGKKADAAAALQKAQPELARGVARGVIHKNTAARKFSRLSKRVASLG